MRTTNRATWCDSYSFGSDSTTVARHPLPRMVVLVLVVLLLRLLLRTTTTTNVRPDDGVRPIRMAGPPPPIPMLPPRRCRRLMTYLRDPTKSRPVTCWLGFCWIVVLLLLYLQVTMMVIVMVVMIGMSCTAKFIARFPKALEPLRWKTFKRD
jgi:hypothetical protein